jgi:hypothetical protein
MAVNGGEIHELADRLISVSKLVDKRLAKKDLSEDERDFLDLISFIMSHGEDTAKRRISGLFDHYSKG